MEIKVLGMGCPKCKKTIELIEETVKELGKKVSVQKVTDINDFMDYGIIMTPAVVIDGKVKMSGKIPSKNDIKSWIQ
ncbi:MAG: TM0996/MTH895 family glutaredoxin-like protein [Spirochaetes bacterium]|nr:TM0996/MTH895 family glutaredoxin-like protein [Spirochaetota bacterium]